ncbi:hypothetical protein EIK77_001881 [Talaromyces pinophilus]|nr:hypothetical protein EIK77_001881 [Talaromyces pinophilus]
MALAYGVSDYIEGGVITAVIIGNILIGFYQEYRAEQKMDALRSLSSPSATVIRNGEVVTIPSTEVVPGDVVLVKTGDTVPADLRLVDGMNLECDEKILTGEAVPVAKDAAFDHRSVVEDSSSANAETHIGVGDRLNMVYSSSTVTKGRGKGIVVYTGMYTEIGKIASSMQGKKRPQGTRNRSMSIKKYGPLQVFRGGFLRSWDALGRFLGLTTGTPLQRKLSKLAYSLFGLAIIFAIIVFGVNKFHVTNEVAIYAISTGMYCTIPLRSPNSKRMLIVQGIAIIPESLIAVLTITMVVGMTQMHKRRVVIRQLSALEALGGVTNICSDKTGTLTQGQMVTRKAWIPGVGVYSVNKSDDASDPSRGFVTLGSASSHKAEVEKQNEKTQPTQTDSKEEQAITEVNPELETFLLASSLCNLATVRYDSTAGKWQTMGDPTEIALQVFAHRFGYGKKTLEADLKWKQIAEYPFDSAIKRMSVIYSKGADEPVIFVKGAVERIIDLCTSVGTGNHEEKMTSELKENILQQMKSLADQGLRVLAIAQRPVPDGYQKGDELAREDVEAELNLLGLAGLYDPPRLETKDAIKGTTPSTSLALDLLAYFT